MNWQNTPPYTSPTTPERPTLSGVPGIPLASTPENSVTSRIQATFDIPINLTQSMVEANLELKRFQQDLLVLTSFNDNSTLHWRPSWFTKPAFYSELWTLHNPPHAVTELLPQRPRGRQVTTRRMRRPDDTDPPYIKDLADWTRYCDLYGVPHDFLCEDQVRLLRLGLLRDSDGQICEPPAWPLYPEPQSMDQGSFILDPNTYRNLPHRFRNIADNMYGWGIIVQPDGALKVDETGPTVHAESQGPGRRWSYIPWTGEQEKSCRPIKMKLVFWNTAMEDEKKKILDRV